jgi:hypothetical protein
MIGIKSLIKQEFGVNCEVCYLDFDSEYRQPQMLCQNNHKFCRPCI